MKLPNYLSIAAQYVAGHARPSHLLDMWVAPKLAGHPRPPRLLTRLVCYLSVFQLRKAMVAMVPMETAPPLVLEYTAACVT